MKLTDVLQDFAFVSLLLLISFGLRNRIKILQKYFIPSALIAGFLGMLLGPQALGKVSPVSIPFTDSLSQWAGVLVIVVCATQFLGLELGKVNRDVMATTFLAGTLHQTQLLVGLGITFLCGKFIKDLPLVFGFMPVWGFYGGHGNAATVGVIIQEAGFWNDAVSVGVTFATIGILSGVIGGMILINYGAKKGYTHVQMAFSSMPASERTGYVEAEKRDTIGSGVTSSSVIDPLAFQICIVGLVVVVGTLIRKFLVSLSPVMSNFPLVGAVLVTSMIFGVIINKTSLKKLIDKPTMNRITGTALEYMIAAAIATTSLQVFVTYAVPLVLISVVIIALNVILSVGLGRIWLRENWFETAVGLYGQVCGVLATGLMLVKVVDPKNETVAAQCISASSTWGYAWQIPYMLVGSLAVVTNPRAVVLVSVIFFLFCLAGGHILFGGKRKTS